MNADGTKHTHQNHYGGGGGDSEGVVKTYHSAENIFYERGSELEEWQLRRTGVSRENGNSVGFSSQSQNFPQCRRFSAGLPREGRGRDWYWPTLEAALARD